MSHKLLPRVVPCVLLTLFVGLCYGTTSTFSYTTNVNSLSGFTYSYENGPSNPQSFEVSDDLLLSRPYTVTAPSNYEVSLYENSGYSNEVIIPGSLISVGTVTIFTRLKTGLAVDAYNGSISITAPEQTPHSAVSENVSVSGSVTRRSTQWNGSTWSNGFPDANAEITLNEDYDTGINGNIVAWSLTVNSGKTLAVANHTYATITTDVVVDGNITVEHHGSFVQTDDSGTFTVNSGGSARVNKKTTPLSNWYNYTYWSSPVSEENAGNAFPSSQYRFVYNAQNFLDELEELGNTGSYVSGHDDIDDNGDAWQGITDAIVLQPGVGYAATHTSTGFSTGTAYTYTFEGAFNTGDITTPIYYNGDNGDNDWNMIGNPYPSAISIDDFFAENTGLVSNAVYLWSQASPPSDDNSGNEALNFNTNDYAVINGSGQIAGGSTEVPCRYIPSGQSFFIQGLANGNATFTNAMRMGDDTSNSQFFRSSDCGAPSASRIWVNLTNNSGTFNQTLIAYIDGATNGTDNSYYDAKKNLGSGASSYLYSLIGFEASQKMAIQGKNPETLDENEVIPLGFIAGTSGQYTISLAQMEGSFPNQNNAFIKDNLLNSYHNISEGEYTFTAVEGEHNDRFEIVFSQETLSVKDFETSDFAIINQDASHIKIHTKDQNQNITNVTLYNIVGQHIKQIEVNGNDVLVDVSQLTRGNYIAEITLTNQSKLTKKFIKHF